jgi:hypothetical protein
MDELERILASEDSFEPSAGFRAGVMDAVRQAAAEPPPLRFPWGRLAVGLASCGVLAAAGTTLAPQAVPALIPAETLAQLAEAAPSLGYAGLAVFLSLAMARLPRLFVRS